MGTTETEVPLCIIAFSDVYPSGEVGYHAGCGDSQSEVRRTATGTGLPGLPEVARKTRKPLTAEELEERRKKVQTRYKYSSPPLIRTPLLSNYSVLVREVSFGEREHYIHSQYLLPRMVFLEGCRIKRVSFERDHCNVNSYDRNECHSQEKHNKMHIFYTSYH